MLSANIVPHDSEEAAITDSDSECGAYHSAELKPRPRALGTAGIVVIGFFWVSGGIYGNEALVCAAPPAYILLFALVTPLVFSLPVALMTAELSTAFPADGGQVAWVADACGRAVGAHNAYWVWLVNVLDASIYPQLMSEYLRRCLRLSPSTEVLLELAMVVFVSAVSMLGVQWIERSQAVMFAVTMLPCLLFIGFGLPHLQPSHLAVFEGDVDWSLLLSWVLWLYSGVSSLGALAGEVAEPRTTYPRAIGVLLPLVITLNLAPFVVSLSLSPERSHYAHDGYFRTLAGEMAGPWLQDLYTAGAVVALFGLFHSQQVVADCTLFAFADRRARGADAGPNHDADADAAAAEAATAAAAPPPRNAPAFAPTPAPAGSLCTASAAHAALRRFFWDLPPSGVPRCYVLANSAAVGALVRLVRYEALVELEMSMYCCSQLLFFYSWLALRLHKPYAPRPFRVPGGMRVALSLIVLPVAVTVLTLGANLASDSAGQLQFSGAIVFGLLVHAGLRLTNWVAQRRYRRNGPSPSVAADEPSQHRRPLLSENSSSPT